MSENNGALAQLGEHLLCKQGVIGSIPISSTIICPHAVRPSGWLRTGPRMGSDAQSRLRCFAPGSDTVELIMVKRAPSS